MLVVTHVVELEMLHVGMTLTEVVEIEIKPEEEEGETKLMDTTLDTPLVAPTMSLRIKINRSEVEVLAAVEMEQEEPVDPKILAFIP